MTYYLRLVGILNTALCNKVSYYIQINIFSAKNYILSKTLTWMLDVEYIGTFNINNCDGGVKHTL